MIRIRTETVGSDSVIKHVTLFNKRGKTAKQRFIFMFETGKTYDIFKYFSDIHIM